MKHTFVLVSASVFAMAGLVPMAQATSLDYVCTNIITEDTTVTIGGNIEGDCTIEVNNARLQIVGVTIDIKSTDDEDGRLTIEDASGDDGAAELIIKNSQITAAERVLIQLAEELEDLSPVPPAWSGGVTFKNNLVDTGDDLRVKATGHGDVIFKNNRGQVVDDIRLGDVIKIKIKDGDDDEIEIIIGGLDGDIDVRNNRITLLDPDEKGNEFVVQSFDGDIDVRNNKFRNNELGEYVARIDITSSSSGDIGVKNNEFINTKIAQAQEIKITSEGGDVGVWKNTFGESVADEEVNIDSTGGDCESKRNSPEIVDQDACP